MTAHDPPRGRNRCWPVLLGLLLVLASGESRAAWYLKIDGVPGELTQGRFAGWTSVKTAGALVCLPVNPTNQTTGPASFSCEVRKAFDRTSPALLQQCGLGTSFRRVTLAYVLTQPQATQYRLTLDNVFVSSVAQDRSTNSPENQEVIRFTFDKIEMACFDLDANGGTTGGLTGLFDQTTAQGALKTRPPFQVTATRERSSPGVLLTWPAERGHGYTVYVGSANGGVWKTTNGGTATADGPLSLFLPTDEPHLLMRVEETD
jgi:type VI protein secretion system component Hcp